MSKKHIFDAGIDLKKSEIANATLQNLFIFPASPKPGQVIYRSDLNVGAYWNATEWVYFGLPEAIRDALFNANSPDETNPFATLDDIPIVPEDFLDLLDVPNAYTGAALKAVRVKATEDGLEFFLIVGIPPGGTTGQVLGKASATDYDVTWIDQTGGGGAEDFTPSTGTVRFDVPRKYGYNGTLESSDIEIDISGAKESNMAKMLHQAAAAPSVSVLSGSVTLHLSGGGYDPAKINEYLFICHKNNAGTVVRISYSISPNLL